MGLFFGGVAHQKVYANSLASRSGFIPQTTPTVLRIQPLSPLPIGKQFDITAILTTADGAPIPDKSVNILIGGVYEGQTRTDAKGQGIVTITSDLSAGKYTVKAVFLGTRQFDASNGIADLELLPSVFEVNTVPALSGVKFTMGGKEFVSNADGVARVNIDRIGTYTLKVVQNYVIGPNQQVEFMRWMDDVFVPYRDVKIPQDNPIQVGFQVNYRVGQNFFDLQNQPVDLNRITSITLKNSQGTSYTFNDGQPRWLPASLVTRRVGGLDVVLIQYSVMSIMVDGSNVVSQAQQRFFAHPGEVWPIQLLLFSAQITAKDAFLGTAIGTGIIMEYPDSTRQRFVFDKSHQVKVNSLARGIYKVQVYGASGFTPITPVALSQNQVVNLTVLTRVDIFIVVTLLSLLAMGLVVVGRTQILNLRQARRETGFPAPQREPGWSTLRQR